MNRSLLTLSVVALFAVALLTVLYVRLSQGKELVDLQFADLTTHAHRLTTDLTTAKIQNSTLRVKVAALDFDLGAARTNLTTSETRAGRLDRDLASAKNLLSLQEQNTRALAAEVASLKNDLADARASNASPEAIAGYKGTITGLEHQLASARNGAAAVGTAGAATAVFASRVGRATVLSVGAQLGQRLNVSHGTEPAATVLISDVRTNFSVAQVQPDSLHGVLQKGDLAVLLR
jgi:hypothetical protein